MRYFLGLIAFTLCLNLFAQEATLSLRTYVNSCGYVSNFSADIKASLTDPSLPQDAEVKLIYGLGNAEERTDWQRLGEVRSKKIGQETREAETSVILAERGKPWHFNTLQFVWQIALSSGEIYYIKGNSSPMGFYEAAFTSIHESRCLSSMKEKPLYRKVQFKTVNR
jgi:hypothetical protein